MEVITIESKAYIELKKKLDVIFEHLSSMKSKTELKESEMWVNADEVCKYLQISSRTLQRLQVKGIIPYSVLSKKAYFKISDIRKVLQSRRMLSKDELIENLKASHLARLQSIREKKNSNSSKGI